jgi:hypothetical protein
VRRNFHSKWPEAPETLAQRLLHVLNIFEGESDDMRIIEATTNTYAPHGQKHSWTGLTLGDIRAITDIMVGHAYTLADYDLGCQFGFTGAVGPRSCSRCGTPAKDYDGRDCEAIVKRFRAEIPKEEDL